MNRLYISAKIYFKYLICFALFFTVLIQYYGTVKWSENDRIIVSKNSIEPKSFKDNLVSTCGRIPLEENIYVDSKRYQVLKTSKNIYFFYGAYLDDRDMAKKPYPLVRILSLVNSYNLSETLYCQLWYDGQVEPIISKTYEAELLWMKGWAANNNYSPYLISCDIPSKKVPNYVTLVEERCDNANNLLKVYHTPKLQKKKNFNVCVKNLDFNRDVSDELIEWMEIIKILGADKVTIYAVNLLPTSMKALKYYQAQGFLDLVIMDYPSGSRGSKDLLQTLHHENICFHDCYYRSLNEYEFIVPIDTDEFMLPLHPDDRTWLDLLNRVRVIGKEKALEVDAFNTRNHYFFMTDKIAKQSNPDRQFYHFLDNTLKTPEISVVGTGTKSFFSTEGCLVVHNHTPLKCLKKFNWCKGFNIDPKDAHLFHYRYYCGEEPETEDCKKFNFTRAVNDTSLWKYKQEIITNFENMKNEIENFDYQLSTST